MPLGGKPLAGSRRWRNIRDWLWFEAIIAPRFAKCWRVWQTGRKRITSAAGTRRPTSKSCMRVRLAGPRKPNPAGSYRDQIAFVADRPGMTALCYRMTRKLQRELGWKRRKRFGEPHRKTGQW